MWIIGKRGMRDEGGGMKVFADSSLCPHPSSLLIQRVASDSCFTRATYAIRSKIRLEYPHSLSYHARILCMCGSTERVKVVSTIEECASPLKSIDTSCSSE